jgi:hypothetical protein
MISRISICLFFVKRKTAIFHKNSSRKWTYMGVYVKLYALYIFLWSEIKFNPLLLYLQTLPTQIKGWVGPRNVLNIRVFTQIIWIHLQGIEFRTFIHKLLTSLGELLLNFLVYTMSDPQEKNITAWSLTHVSNIVMWLESPANGRLVGKINFRQFDICPPFSFCLPQEALSIRRGFLATRLFPLN